MKPIIQFMLLGDGASHKYLGINPVYGLQKLGIDAEYYFRNRNSGVILPNPDYTFYLKPNNNDFNIKGSDTKVLIINDQRLPLGFESLFDFFVSPSLDWQKEYQNRHPEIPCYLIQEEINYCTTKIHKDTKELKLVTTGYSVNLIEHFLPIVPLLKKVTNNITVITNTDFDIFKKAGCNVRTFQPHYTKMFDSNYDQIMVEQFKEYDVGIVTQYEKSGRTSNRAKLLNYAGLPVICNSSANHQDIWFNGEYNMNCYVNCLSDWEEHLRFLRDIKMRQVCVDYNSILIKHNSGSIQSAKSFLGAIKQYENTN